MKYRRAAVSVVAVMLVSAAAAFQVWAASAEVEEAPVATPVAVHVGVAQANANVHGIALRPVKFESDAPFGDQVLPFLQRLVPS